MKFSVEFSMISLEKLLMNVIRNTDKLYNENPIKINKDIKILKSQSQKKENLDWK